ncbi:MAG: hypothetical protein AAF206_01455 [Bacteroidota bacterium]
MLTAEKLTRRFATEKLTPGTRILALGFYLLNIPALLVGICFPPAYPVVIPGAILFFLYVMIAHDHSSAKGALMTWIGTAVYNGIGVAFCLSFITEGGLPRLNELPLMIPSFIGLGVGLLGIRLISEKQENQFNPASPISNHATTH